MPNEPSSVSLLLELIRIIIDCPHTETEDGFLVLVEICYNEPAQSLDQVLKRAAKETGCEDMRHTIDAYLFRSSNNYSFRSISEIEERLDEELPLDKAAITELSKRYHNRYG